MSSLFSSKTVNDGQSHNNQKKKKIRIKRGVVLQIGFENTMERKFEQWRSLKENFNLNDTEDENQKETIVYFGNVIKKKKGKMVK